MVDVTSFEWPHSIRGINGLEDRVKEAIYLSLIPDSLFKRFNVDRWNRDRLEVICPRDTRSVELRLYPGPDAEPPIDPIFYLHMADTLNFQIAILLVTVNDPNSERFYTDVDEHGLPTRFGTLRRNIPEEIRAMEAGLAPGQIRQGLRISSEAIPTFETFLGRTGHEMVIIEPLSYHNAIVFERYGFRYFQGRRRMEWINDVLRPGGDYFERLDGSTPFQQSEHWQRIRGRSWAIHDGILGEPFGDVRMYKQIGKHANLNTFPDGRW